MQLVGGHKAQQTDLEISNTLIIQFLFMIPMFTVLSCDFGRTIPYWVFSSLMAVACFGKLDLNFLRKFKIELQFSVSDIDLNNLYLKTPRG